jgi:Aldo/keto reductase family
LHGFDKSARKLGVDQIDLLILHQALPSDFAATLEAYRALESLLADGKVRAIGVSNFMVDHLTALLDRAKVVPAVNQIEVHPYFTQREVREFCVGRGILIQAWSPIGGITFYRDGSHGSTLQDPVIGATAEAHGKSPAQVHCDREFGGCRDSRASYADRIRDRITQHTGKKLTCLVWEVRMAAWAQPVATVVAVVVGGLVAYFLRDQQRAKIHEKGWMLMLNYGN